MLSEVSESSTSAGRRDGQREAPSKPPAPVVLLRTSEKEPPPYGAQHRQDALWEGGNDALPPQWYQYKVSDEIQYQDNTLIMVSYDRPLPGVRLDEPGDLVVPGWEWHISPLGRSYFVNHNTRTTSWKKPKPGRPAGSLTPECIIEGHSKTIWSLAYLKASCNIMSVSSDGSIRQWKRDGELVGKPLESDEERIGTMTVSPDETMVVCGDVDGRLRLWNIKEGNMIGEPWEGHDDAVKCLDWSPNALEIASGSQDGTIRRWNPDTGRQIAPPIKTRHDWVNAVKYSPQGNKFISGGDGGICVWSRDGKLLKEINGHDIGVMSLRWSKDGAHIFSGSLDNTIRKWRAIDGKELVVLRGHTHPVRSLCLTPNERYIVSASYDYSVRIWDLKTNQPVGDPLLHDDEVFAVVMSPDGKYIASAGLDKKIYVWGLEAALERHRGADDGNAKLKATQPRVVRQPIPNTGGSAKYGKDFFADHSNRPTAPPANSSLLNWRSLFGSTDAPRPSPRESRHRNFSLLRLGKSRRTVDVALAQDEDRYGITPETDAEAAAAMQRTDGDEADNSTQPGQPAPGVQASQVQPIQTLAQVSTSGPEDIAFRGLPLYVRRPPPGDFEDKLTAESIFRRDWRNMTSSTLRRPCWGAWGRRGDRQAGNSAYLWITEIRIEKGVACLRSTSLSNLLQAQRSFSIGAMLSEMSESSTSAGRREAQREAPSKSPAPVVLLRTSEKEPPPYGAQHRQDALWEGGNDALPPRWHQSYMSDKFQYQDDTLIMVSWNRPLPGVRLDNPGQLVDPEYEWHISPLGRSFFVNHNTRTTSWKKPKPERPAGSLTPECIIEGHSNCIWSLACLKASCNVMSASSDGSIRQWKRDGEPVGKPWYGDGGGIGPMAVSPDETMVVGGSADGRLQLWNIKEGSMIGDPWEGHDAEVKCLDWSPDALAIASGSEDGTIRRWNPDTGRQIAPPIKTRHDWVNAVKYSPQGDKFISGGDGGICVWSRDGKLLIEIKGHDRIVTSLCWSKDGAHIFSGSLDLTIRKWRAIDGKELVVLRGLSNLSSSFNTDFAHYQSRSTSLFNLLQARRSSSIGAMLSEVSESSTSAGQRDGQREAPSKPPALFRTSEKEPPPYGAQHRRDALWEGGNDALPPRWRQFKASDEIYYQDDTLIMVSWNRPLPGVRLDDPGQLVDPEYEWHISPLGRSYFVNHNTRTTSWKKPKPEHPAGSLSPQCIIEGHSRCIWSLAYLKASCNVMSASDDGLILQWKRDGEPVGKPLDNDGGGVGTIAVSPDETMVVCGNVDGGLRLWNIKEGSMIGDPWEGHDGIVRSLDWSPNALEIASGSQDGTIRRWNPDTGRQIAPPIETSHGWVFIIKYSPQGDKFISGGDGVICIWSKDGKLLIEIEGHDAPGDTVTSLCWSKDGAHIFSGSLDHTIRKWRAIDGKELVVLRGHHSGVTSLCLTPDERYIVSASNDFSVRIWDLKINQAVGDPLLHDDYVFAVAMSPDGKYIGDGQRPVRMIGRPAQPRIPNTGGSAKYGKDFFADHSNRPTAPSANTSLLNWRSLFSSTDVPRPSPRESRHRNFLNSLHFATRPNAPQSISLQSRRWNFHLFPGGSSIPTVEVAAGRKKNRIYVSPPSAAEVARAEAAAAAQHANGNQASSSAQPNTGGSAKYGKDFFADHSNRPTAPQANISLLNWRSLFSSTDAPRPSPRESRQHNFLNSLHFANRPNAPQSISLQSRRWDFNLFPGGSSIPTVEVAAGRKKNRIYVSPPSAAEVARAEAAAAAQHANGNQVSSLTQVGQPQASPGTRVSQGPTEKQGAGGGTGDVSYEGVNCCGFFFGRRRPASHQS
ncbi:WD40 repeat-like protein [Suillus brevipes Sb2]|nr:WD40 repeat-like protein [Suillus brevipes Sb2]